MKNKRFLTLTAVILATLILLVGCGEDEEVSSGKRPDHIDKIESNSSTNEDGGNNAPSTPDDNEDDPVEDDKSAEKIDPSQCTDHSFVERIPAPATCTKPGVKFLTCSKCGTEQQTEDPVKNHTVVNDQCTVCGLKAATNLEFAPTADGKAMEVIGLGRYAEHELIVPSTYEGKPVVAVSGLGNSDLKHVQIPDSVTKIGDRAFEYCEDLCYIVCPDTITEIGQCAFYDCRIYNFTIPKGVTKINIGTFYYCKMLFTVTLHENITEIGDSAFCFCYNLEKVVLPEKIDSIPDSAFYQCESLTDIGSIKNIKHIARKAFDGCKKLNFTDMPAQPYTIGESAFNSSGITGMLLYDNIKTIPSYAFAHCDQLEEIILPEGVESIKEGAFTSCDKLVTITLPKSIKEVSEACFDSCENLKTIYCLNSSISQESLTSGNNATVIYQ